MFLNCECELYFFSCATIRSLFKEIRLNSDISNIILDCESSKLAHIFAQARETGMMKDKKYFITSLVSHGVKFIPPPLYCIMDCNGKCMMFIGYQHSESRRFSIHGYQHHSI